MGENKNKSETPGFKLLVNCYAKPNPSFLRTYLDLFIFFYLQVLSFQDSQVYVSVSVFLCGCMSSSH